MVDLNRLEDGLLLGVLTFFFIKGGMNPSTDFLFFLKENLVL
jgi:hypothetical protein